MKNISKKSLIVASLLLSTSLFAENRVIVDIMPGSVLVSSDVDGFTNSRGGNRYFASESVEGTSSFMPNISVGYGLDLPMFSLDASVGVGYLANGVFDASYKQVELAAYWTTLKKGFMIGPFVRYMNFSDPNWETDNLEMKGTSAQAFGIAMMTGGQKVKFKMKVSALSGADIDVEGKNGYMPSSNSISLDGTAVELGVALRF